MRPSLLFAAVMLLAACNHSDSFVTGDMVDLPALPSTEGSTQLTYNPGDDYAPSLSADGTRLIYVFSTIRSTPLQPDGRCVAMMPSTGGTRSFTMCETRSSQADSVSMFLSPTVRPGTGELMFMQGIGQPSKAPTPKTMGLWLADTSDPLARRHELRHFPTVIGDSNVDVLTNTTWVDPGSFVSMAVRLQFVCRDSNCPVRDTLQVPLYLVRGTLAGDTVNLAQIRGTERAGSFGLYGEGKIVFAQSRALTVGSVVTLSYEPFVRMVPVGGGTPKTLNLAGGSVRGLVCRQLTCLVLSSSLQIMSMTTNQLTAAFAGPAASFAAWDSPILSPDGTRLFFRMGRNLYVRPVQLP